jgi:hypothetical protein
MSDPLLLNYIIISELWQIPQTQSLGDPIPIN